MCEYGGIIYFMFWSSNFGQDGIPGNQVQMHKNTKLLIKVFQIASKHAKEAETG